MTLDVKNSLNAHCFPKQYEKNSGKSKTIPDQSLTVKQIMDRFARGLPINGIKVPIYDPEDTLPDPAHMDLAERQEMMEHAAREIQITKKRLDNANKNKTNDTKSKVDDTKSKTDDTKTKVETTDDV